MVTKTDMNPKTEEILAYVVGNRAAFSLQIAHALNMWFTDVDDALDELVQRGYVEPHESAFGLHGHIYSPSMKGIRYREKTAEDQSDDPPYSDSGEILPICFLRSPVRYISRALRERCR